MDFKSQDYFQALVHVLHHSFCNTSVLIHFHIPCDVNVNPLLLAYLNLGFAFVFVSVFFCLFVFFALEIYHKTDSSPQ